MEQIRSFVSIDLEDSRILSEIQSVMLTILGLGGDLKTVASQNIHLTLKFLGNVDAPRIELVKQALSEVRFSKFEARVSGAGAFPSIGRMNVIWVGVGEGWSNVLAIFEQTEKLLADIGFARESRRFSPHITIARVRSGRHRDEIGNFLRGLEQKDFGAFTVDRVRLKRSVLAGSGPSYSTLFETPAQQA